MSRVVLVPGVLALLPEYASIDDPVAELRSACLVAVGWLLEAGPVVVLADDQGRRVAEHLVSEVEAGAQGAGVSRLRRQGAFAPQPPEAGGSGAARQGAFAPQPPEAGGSGTGRRGAFAPQPPEVGGSGTGRRGAFAPQPPEAGGSGTARQGAFAPQPPEAGGSGTGRQGAFAPPPDAGVLAVGNGSARRSEKAPGHLDERAPGFDAELARALTAPDPTALAAIDPATSAELLAATDSIRVLGDVLTAAHEATVDYDGDPYGVQYWVVRWEARLP